METIGLESSNSVDVTVLWETYNQRIFRYVLSLTGQRAIAEDLTQETFLQAIRDVRRFAEPPANEAAWLFRIATNRARDHFRRRWWSRWLPLALHRRDISFESVPDTTDSLVEQDVVRQALRRLPQETAAMLLLKDAEGFTTREIADMLRQNHDAVRKRLARARSTLRLEYLRLTGGEEL